MNPIRNNERLIQDAFLKTVGNISYRLKVSAWIVKAFMRCNFVFFSLNVGLLLAWNHSFIEAKHIDAPQENISPQMIVDRAIVRAEEQFRSLVDAQFESQVLMSIQSLDENGQITKTESTRYHQYPVNGALFEELIEKDGRTLNSDERKDEENNKRKFIREVERRKKEGLHPQPLKKPGIQFNTWLMSRYRLKMLRTEEIDGRRCWVIDFEPKEGDLPVKEMMDRALNQSTGTLWIVQEDFGLARLDFVMRKPFRYWGGLLAVIRNTEGRLDFHRVKPNVWMPVSFDLKLDLNVMVVKNIRRHIIKKWSDYRPMNRLAGSPGNK